jgi:SAM-dependent methyltransferase
MSDPRADIVSRQYTKWTYPLPVEDLDEWKIKYWDKGDPSHAHRILWPDREYKPDMDILIAGCGTNQAAQYAFMNPAAKVMGIDISQSSLNHQQYLKDKHDLQNLELRLLPIEELPTVGLDFDLIVSSGVLHHMADPLAGLKALAPCLRKDGAMVLMLYAKYGRIGVQILQSVFCDMGFGQDEESVHMVKQVLAWLRPSHLVGHYLDVADDLQYDAGLVDTFLHRPERSYTVDDCIDFVESAGLTFQGWLDKAKYYAHDIVAPNDEVHAALRGLPDRKIWSLMDRLRTQNGCHLFIACRPDRPKESYTIDFSTLESLGYVPSMRIGCGLNGAEIYKDDWRMSLDRTQLAFALQLDGKRTIRQIVSAVQHSGVADGSRAKMEEYGRTFFESLWKLDFIAVAFGETRPSSVRGSASRRDKVPGSTSCTRVSPNVSDPRADIVADQYSKWTYPLPVEDLDEWQVESWDKGDPSHAHRIYWPNREYKPGMDILIAGCGTNQAAEYAFMNPAAKVTGIDISQSSLNHQQYLRDKHELQNLELHLLPIEELPTLGLDFDLIVSSGVLHHMADPLAGLQALAACLRKDGAMMLMLYAKYGRIGVQILQSVFRDMGLGQDEESVHMVKQVLAWLPWHHLVRSYLELADDLQYDAGLVDTFLHGREHSYTVDDCIDFVESAGLTFQGWLNKSQYYVHEIIAPTSEVNLALRGLPDRKIWSLMDRLRTQNGCHLFIACRPDRPKESYTIDFKTLESLSYVPSMRKGCGLNGAEIYKDNWRMGLDPTQLAFVQQVDGTRTIRQIVSAVRHSGAAQGSTAKIERYGRMFFESLWQLDFIAVAFGNKTPS